MKQFLLLKKYWLPIVVIIAVTVAFNIIRTVFRGEFILPQVIHIGNFGLRAYGICLALAILAGYLVIFKSRHPDVSPKKVDRMIFAASVGGLVGARIYHVFSSFDYYTSYPGQIMQIWLGGLSIYGAVLGGIIGLWLAWRLEKNSNIKFLTILDWFVPGVVLGQIIGRFGNFFNYELFGYPTHLPWKMFVPGYARPDLYVKSEFFHPLFLYEALWSAVILAVIYKLLREKQGVWSKPGTLFLSYIFLYNIGRFFLEFLRIDSVFIGNFRQNAIVSAVLAVLALVCIIARKYGKVPQNS